MAREAMKTIQGDRNATRTNMYRHHGAPHTQTHRHPKVFITQTKTQGKGWQGLKPAAGTGSCSCQHRGPKRTLRLPNKRIIPRSANRVIKTPLVYWQGRGSYRQLTSHQPGKLSLFHH